MLYNSVYSKNAYLKTRNENNNNIIYLEIVENKTNVIAKN